MNRSTEARKDRGGHFDSRSHMLLVILKHTLFVAGVAMLAYVGFTIAEARFMQHYETLKFDRELVLRPGRRDLAKPVEIRPGDPIGKLTIPSAGISAIVLEGDDSATLKVAPGHVPGTALPSQVGNVAIAAHRDTYFRNLATVRVGDEVTLTTLRGVYRYKVDSMRVVAPDRTDVLKPTGRPTLTLITCYPFHFIGPAPKRFIIQGHLVFNGKDYRT